MTDINRLIASAGNQPNLAQSFIGGLGARQQFTQRDLANTAAQNQLDRQANVNRLLQQQGQALLSPQPQVTPQPVTGAPVGAQPQPTAQPDFASLLTDADRDRVRLAMAGGDVAELNKIRQEVTARSQTQATTQRETKITAAAQESGLRKEFDKASGEFIKVRDAFTRITKSADKPSPAGDLSLVFNFMKVLDPGSTVREGEFNTAANAQAALGRAENEGSLVPNFVKSALDRLTLGTLLLPEQRQDFVSRAGNLFQGAQASQQQNIDRFTGIATRGGLDPQNVVFKFSTPSGATVEKKAKDITVDDASNMSDQDLDEFIKNHPDNQ